MLRGANALNRGRTRVDRFQTREPTIRDSPNGRRPHIALADATSDRPGIVVCEVPAKPQWCEISHDCFGWTRTRFPSHIRSTRKLKLKGAPAIVSVTLIALLTAKPPVASSHHPHRRKNSN